MFSAIRRRMHVSPSMVIAVVALVFATTGGAFAMSGAGAPAKTTASTAKAKKSKSKAKAKAGPRGPSGAAGKNGAPGAGGPQGAAGPQGPAGLPGAAGATGATGEIGAAGKEGAAGPQGSPWVAGGTLPSEQTETGVWGRGYGYEPNETGVVFFPISFPLPLEKAPTLVFVAATEESATGCPGRGGNPTPGIPQAEPGFLCIYAGAMVEAKFEAGVTFTFNQGLAEWVRKEGGTSPAGTLLEIKCLEEECIALGSWAVTAE